MITRYQRAMQRIVSTYLSLHDNLNQLRKIKVTGYPDLDKTIIYLEEDLENVEVNCEFIFRNYSRSMPASKWAFEEVQMPSWASAGVAAGIPDNLESATHLVALAGVEARRYVSPEEAKNIMMDFLNRSGYSGDRKHYRFSVKEVADIGSRISRSIVDILEMPDHDCYSWDEIFLWATKRTHSDYLRTVSLPLGEWIEVHSQNHYHQYYQKVMDEQSDKIIKENKPLTLAQVTHRARTSAVRVFLTDYYHKMVGKVAA